MTKFGDVIDDIAQVITEHKNGDTDKSYIAKIYGKGRKKLAQKVGEEAVEVAIAATDNDKGEVISESADLIFHLMLLWEKMNVTADDVADKLNSRKGISGLEEKNSRKD